MAPRDARTSPPEESSAARVRQTLAAAADRARGRVRPLVFSYQEAAGLIIDPSRYD